MCIVCLSISELVIYFKTKGPENEGRPRREMLRSYIAGHSSERGLPGPGAPSLKTMKPGSASGRLTWVSSDGCIKSVLPEKI